MRGSVCGPDGFLEGFTVKIKSKWVIVLILFVALSIIILTTRQSGVRTLLEVEARGGTPFVTFSPDGQKIATVANSNCFLEIWEIDRAQRVALYDLCPVNDDNVQNAPTFGGIFYAPDGQTIFLSIIVSEQESRIERRSIQTGEIQAVYEDFTGLLAISRDGSKLAALRSESVISLLDVATGNQILMFDGHRGFVNCFAFNSAGTLIVSADGSSQAIVWNATTGDELFRLSEPREYVQSCEFSPDDTRILTTGYNTTAREFQSADGVQIRGFEYEAWVFNSAYNYDGSMIALALYLFHDVIFVDSATGATLCTINHSLPYLQNLHDIVFSPVNDTIAIIAAGNVVIWRIECR